MLHFVAQLRDCDIGAIVNRELQQRVRSVSGLTVHRPVTKQDVKFAAKLIQMLDDRWKLWHDQTDEKKDKEKEVMNTVYIVCYFCLCTFSVVSLLNTQLTVFRVSKTFYVC